MTAPVVGIEGADFAAGQGFTPAAVATVERALAVS